MNLRDAIKKTAAAVQRFREDVGARLGASGFLAWCFFAADMPDRERFGQIWKELAGPPYTQPGKPRMGRRWGLVCAVAVSLAAGVALGANADEIPGVRCIADSKICADAALDLKLFFEELAACPVSLFISF
jgi:hypothetical protein